MVKKWFNVKSSFDRNFSVGELVLRWDKQHKDNKEYTNFQHFWMGPFIITKNIGPSIVRLQKLDGVIDTYLVNVIQEEIGGHNPLTLGPPPLFLLVFQFP